MYYIIADLHFCNQKKAISRGFSDYNLMNQMIIDKWNQIITKNDDVFVFGKVFDRTAKIVDIRKILNSLNGKVHLGSFKKNNTISRTIWKHLGFNNVWDCRFVDKIVVNGLEKQVIFATNSKDDIIRQENQYYCVDEDIQTEPYKDGALCLSAELWDYTPIAVKNLSELFNNMITFEQMEDFTHKEDKK